MMKDVEIEEFNKLLSSFKGISIKESSPLTLMEIAGFPRWENVCSNVLAFYLNPLKEHGLQDLVLSSLLEITDLGIPYQKSNLFQTTVSREVSTDEKNRIDLVIENENFVIGIENKIDADLYNDLNDYRSQIIKVAGNKKFACLVLAPIKYNNLDHDFIGITYNELFANIKKKIVDYMAYANNKYALFLIDFITTLEKKTYMENNPEFYRFCVDNNESIAALVNAHTKLVDDIYEKFKKAVNHIYEQNGFSPKFLNMRISYRCEAFDVFLKESNIRFQYEYPIINGWKFCIWKERNKPFPLSEAYKILKNSAKHNSSLREDSGNESEVIKIEYNLFESEQALFFVEELVRVFKFNSSLDKSLTLCGNSAVIQ